MKILLLGIGLQGQAALYDLLKSVDVEQIVAVDLAIDALRQKLPFLDHEKVVCSGLDVNELSTVAALMRDADVVINLLPAQFRYEIAEEAVNQGVHIIDASYADPRYKNLHRSALDRGVGILPEFGLDPGIDLLLTAKGMAEFDEIHELHSYGAGIPEFDAADNALKYKISWSFEGVLSGYTRPASIIREGCPQEISGEDIFLPEFGRSIEIDRLGLLEAYPNGDAVQYIEMLGLSDQVREAGRYSLRWPGHSEFWRTLVSLGFLADQPIQFSDQDVIPRKFLQKILEPQLQYAAQDRDIALVRIEMSGMKNGSKRRLVYQVLDYRDLETGFLAMQRTVGFTASIGAQMLVRGEISKRGLLSPLRDVPVDNVLQALKKRGIIIQQTEERDL